MRLCDVGRVLDHHLKRWFLEVPVSRGSDAVCDIKTSVLTASWVRTLQFKSGSRGPAVVIMTQTGVGGDRGSTGNLKLYRLPINVKASADGALTVSSPRWSQSHAVRTATTTTTTKTKKRRKKKLCKLFDIACRYNESSGIVGRLSDEGVVKVQVWIGCCFDFAPASADCFSGSAGSSPSTTLNSVISRSYLRQPWSRVAKRILVHSFVRVSGAFQHGGWWWWLFSRVRGFWENVRQFIPCLRFSFFFFKWRLACAH